MATHQYPQDFEAARQIDPLARATAEAAGLSRYALLLEDRIAELETALAALCQVCDGPLDNPAWPGVLADAHAVLEGKT